MTGHDLTTEIGVVALMSSSNTAAEWNANARAVKKANGDDYPDFWWRAIVMSGVADATSKRWGGSAAIKIEVFGPR